MLKISNHDIKTLWLKSHGLLGECAKKLDVLETIKALGFVQVDSIQNVTRAHHHILWSRDKRYEEEMLDALLLEKGKVFEHFTHDASVLPVAFYPMWRGHFTRLKDKLDKSKYYKDLLDEEGKQAIKERMKAEGALHAKDFKGEVLGEKGRWSRYMHKTTLDYMWHCGELATAYRKSFRKYYDLRENIIPLDILQQHLSEDAQVDWLCTKALDVMSVASVKEIKDFWGSLSVKEVKQWIADNPEKMTEVLWEDSMGKLVKSFASLDIEKRLKNLTYTDGTIEIINPFDPTIRDRIRLQKIFGFAYKIEIFVPKEKRKWGYYVYPLLQGNTFIARIEVQADRKAKQLNVLHLWMEEGVVWDDIKQVKLDEALASFALLVGIDEVVWLKKHEKKK